MTLGPLGPLGEIKSLDQGIAAVYVMRLDFTTGGGETGSPEAFIFPVLKRKNGILCAVPLDFIPDESLDGGNFSAMEDLIGPSSSDGGDGWDRACPGLRDSVGGFLQSQSRCPAGSELSTCSSSTLGRGEVLFSCRGGGVDGAANSSNKAEEAKGSGGPQKSDHSSSCRTTIPEALPNITGGGPRLPPHQQPCAPAAVKETSGVKLRSQIFLPSSL